MISTGTAACLPAAEPIEGITIAGVSGWTTTVSNGSFGLGSGEPVDAVMHRWATLQHELADLGARRLATGVQVHGDSVTTHGGEWWGWLRQRDIDGHATKVRGTALAVTVADCTPVFIAHPTAIALLHAGWRGTAANILQRGLEAMMQLGCAPDECQIHLGPSICVGCYEVGPEVIRAVTGRPASAKGFLDVRQVLAEQAGSFGVRIITTSAWCTRCGGGRFFSHRAGDTGRQLGILALL
ncbi:MAG: polyphenol oxidase family protein [Gemmatimonadota bacterium]|nr:polyphenol oxidase family protein [Gemmatimonadota bacterium]